MVLVDGSGYFLPLFELILNGHDEAIHYGSGKKARKGDKNPSSAFLLRTYPANVFILDSKALCRMTTRVKHVPMSRVEPINMTKKEKAF